MQLHDAAFRLDWIAVVMEHRNRVVAAFLNTRGEDTRGRL